MSIMYFWTLDIKWGQIDGKDNIRTNQCKMVLYVY